MSQPNQGQEHFVIYVGDDAQTYQQIQSQLSSRGLAVQWGAELRWQAELWSTEWNRIFIVDADPATPEGLAQLRRMRACLGGTPIIVLSPTRSMTTIGLARVNGAEAICWKPVNSAALLEAIDRAMCRLGQWREAAQVAVRSSDPAAGAPV